MRYVHPTPERKVVALAIDRNLANKISYPFLWGTVVLTVIWSVVSQLIRAFAYMGGNLAMSPDASMGSSAR